MTTASYVIRERATGKVICETFQCGAIKYLKPAFEAVPIQEYLAALNGAATEVKHG